MVLKKAFVFIAFLKFALLSFPSFATCDNQPQCPFIGGDVLISEEKLSREGHLVFKGFKWKIKTFELPIPGSSSYLLMTNLLKNNPSNEECEYALFPDIPLKTTFKTGLILVEKIEEIKVTE
jgi:hypothetical protein